MFLIHDCIKLAIKLINCKWLKIKTLHHYKLTAMLSKGCSNTQIITNQNWQSLNKLPCLMIAIIFPLSQRWLLSTSLTVFHIKIRRYISDCKMWLFSFFNYIPKVTEQQNKPSYNEEIHSQSTKKNEAVLYNIKHWEGTYHNIFSLIYIH